MAKSTQKRKTASKAKSTAAQPSNGKDMADKLAAFHVCGLTESGGGKLQPVLVMQGGGALGAYQAGVYEALHQADYEPDWVIGTSIGAINAGIIAGNRKENRLAALKEFWQRMSRDNRTHFSLFNPFPAATTMMFGLPGFFKPQPLALFGLSGEKGPESAALYSTSPLAKTLQELIDVTLLDANAPRLTVGAVNIADGTMRYFDSRDDHVTLRHLMASGALPPAFPAVEIDGAYYWDGGILSNTPIEAIFDDRDRHSALVFSVEVWHGQGAVPNSVNDALARHKDIQFASRDESHISRQQQLHRLRHVIAELVRYLPPEASELPDAIALAEHGCQTRMHVVRLSAPILEGEDYTKDIDFSPLGVESRWQAGREDTLRMLDKMPWTHGPFDALDGVVVHQALPQSLAEPDFAQAPMAAPATALK